MKRIEFTSVLGERYRGALECLLYCSPEKAHGVGWVCKTVERYGAPHICSREGRLWIAMGRIPEVESLFAVQREPLRRDRLIGSATYLRDRPEKLTVAYVAVADDFLMAESNGGVPLVLLFLERLLEVAHQIKGVTTMEVAGSSGRFIEIPVGNGHRRTMDGNPGLRREGEFGNSARPCAGLQVSQR